MTRFLKLFMGMFAVMFTLNLVLWTLGYAQTAPVEAGMPWWKPLLLMVSTSVLPALWTAIGPMATAWITGQVNKVRIYVPRWAQVAISALVTASAAALLGEVVDTTDAMTAGEEAAVGQVLAATPPSKLRTDPPPQS